MYMSKTHHVEWDAQRLLSTLSTGEAIADYCDALQYVRAGSPLFWGVVSVAFGHAPSNTEMHVGASFIRMNSE